MTKESIFLLLAAVGLTPIALSYGLVPQASLPYLFNIEVSNINSTHMFRAIMGLYLALVVFWIVGARWNSLTLPALWSLTVFMLGLAAGRAVSFVFDGMPHYLLTMYFILELGFGFVGFYLAIRFQEKQGCD